MNAMKLWKIFNISMVYPFIRDNSTEQAAKGIWVPSFQINARYVLAIGKGMPEISAILYD